MGELLLGVLCGAIFTLFAVALISPHVTPNEEIFKRGHMVQCVGVTGYYWECEK